MIGLLTAIRTSKGQHDRLLAKRRDVHSNAAGSAAPTDEVLKPHAPPLDKRPRTNPEPTAVPSATCDARQRQQEQRDEERRASGAAAGTSGGWQQGQCARRMAAAPFCPSAFYSTQRLRHVEERVLRFLAAVRQRLEPGGAAQPQPQPQPPVWRVFPTQQLAFDFADAHAAAAAVAASGPVDSAAEPLAAAGGSAAAGRDPRVFSLECSGDGRRRFLATSYAELWRRYRDLLPQHRHVSCMAPRAQAPACPPPPPRQSPPPAHPLHLRPRRPPVLRDHPPGLALPPLL